MNPNGYGQGEATCGEGSADSKDCAGPKAAAEPMEVDPVEEASLEDQIQELEAMAGSGG